MTKNQKRKIIKSAIGVANNKMPRGPMSMERPDVLMDYKIERLLNAIDAYNLRQEDKDDLKNGIIRDKFNRRIIGKTKEI